jgi:hypothetical protein
MLDFCVELCYTNNVGEESLAAMDARLLPINDTVATKAYFSYKVTTV